MRVKRTLKEQFEVYDKIADTAEKNEDCTLQKIAKKCHIGLSTVHRVLVIYEAFRDEVELPDYCLDYPGVIMWAARRFPNSSISSKYFRIRPVKHNYPRYSFRTSDIYRYIMFGIEASIAYIRSYKCTKNSISVVYDDGVKASYDFTDLDEVLDAVKSINKYLNGYASYKE